MTRAMQVNPSALSPATGYIAALTQSAASTASRRRPGTPQTPPISVFPP